MKLIFALLLIFPNVFGLTTSYTGVTFTEFTYEEALSKADDEGKLILVNYNALDVDPCIQMIEVTFKDAEVANFINQRFLSIDANLDEEIGKQWIQKFNVDCLPTLMVFDANGKLEGMNQGTLSPTALLNWLRSLSAVRSEEIATTELIKEKHLAIENTSPSIPSDEKIDKPTTQVDEAFEIKIISELEINNVTDPNLTNKATLPEIQRKLKAAEGTYTKARNPVPNKFENIKDKEVSNSTSFKPVIEEEKAPFERVKIPVESDLTDTSSTRTMSFSVQIGAYSNYLNAQKQMEKSAPDMNNRSYIIEEKKDGKLLYKVVVGTFTTRGQATQALEELKLKGYNGFLRRI